MPESKNRRTIRQSLKRLIRQNTKEPEGGLQTKWRAMLKGGALARTAATKKARNYLAILTMEQPVAKPLPASLNGVVSELRQSANNVRLHCTLRIQSLEKLARIEGLSFGLHHGDSLDMLIDRELGLTAPEPVESLSATKIRDGARRAALDEVRKNYLLDLSEGRFRGLSASEIAECLRLDGMEPVAIPEDVGERLLREFYEKERVEIELRKRSGES